MNPKYNLFVIIETEVVLRCENTLQNKRTIKKIFSCYDYEIKIN
jgi:hypothetical protein